MPQNDTRTNPGTGSTGRRQFSSCDLCRKSRIACDSSKLLPEHQQRSPGSPGADVLLPRPRCTNCARRAVPCTYEWIRNRKNKSVAVGKEAGGTRSRRLPSRSQPGSSRTTASRVTTPPTAENGGYRELTPNSDLSQRAEAVELHNLLWIVFSEIFEPVLALWTGPDCSPYPVPAHMSGLTVLQLVVSLDWANCTCANKNSMGYHKTSNACPRCDRSVQVALISSVHAFSLRWLPLVTNNTINAQQLISLGDRLWQNARTKVMSVFDKLSYRTVMALYLFGLTPIYEGAVMDEETARTASEISIDMALRQLARLRVKRHDAQFSGTASSPSAGEADRESQDRNETFNEDFIHAENMIYWAGVVFDTSAAMTRGSPSVLCSGIFGFEQEPVFRLIIARVELFHESTETWRHSGFIPTSSTVLYIVHRASTWKGYVWKIIGALREAINYGYEESVITRVQTLLSEALERYDKTFRPLLTFVDLLQLHYHMGLVLLCSLASSIQRVDLVPEFGTVQRESVHVIFTIISFGLSNQVALDKIGATHNRNHASLISLDPYPHHVLMSLQLAADVLLVYLERGEIAHDAFESSCQIVFEALDELPQCLRSVQRGKRSLHHKLVEEPLGGGTSLPGHPHLDLHNNEIRQVRQVARDEHHIRDEDFTLGESSSTIAGPDQVASLSTMRTSNIDEAGLDSLSKTLFSKPTSVLSTTIPLIQDGTM